MPKIKDIKTENINLITQLIDDSASAIYVCDCETYELLFINQRVLLMTGKTAEAAKGKTCYQYLKNIDKPCEPCYMKSATRDSYNEREYSSPTTGKHYMTRGKIIDWGNRLALIEYLTDETDRVNEKEELHKMLDGLPGGVGIYNYYGNGRLEKVYLNDGYYKLIDSVREERNEFGGFSVLDAIYPADLANMQKELESAIEDNRQANADIRVLTGKGKYKWLNISANICAKNAEKCTLYAFYSDIDQLKNTQLQLSASYRAMEIASKNRGVSFWLYNLDTKQLKQEFQNVSPLNYPMIIENMPETMLGTGDIYPEDEPEAIRLYNDILADAKDSECTIRMMNHYTKKYEWQHMVYTRINDSIYNARVAIGFSSNVDYQQENQLRYEHELQLRKELMKDALTYYQLNLTTGIIEEYHSQLNDTLTLRKNISISDDTRNDILRNVYEEDRDILKNNLFSYSLLEHFKNGKTNVTVIYRKLIEGLGVRWIRSVASIMERPNSGELLAFIYSQNIDTEYKDRLAIESIMDEEIESLTVINVKTGLAHLVKVREDIEGLAVHHPFDFDKRMDSMLEKEINQLDKDLFEEFFKVEKIVKKLEMTNTIKVAFRLKEKDQRVMRKKCRAFYLDDTHEDIIIISRDITDLYEEEQRQKNILQQAVDTANAANHAKSDFLSRMSHDMRTPLTAILALSSDELIVGANDKVKDDYLEKIHSSGEYLLGIINDVLDMSRIENKRLTLQLEPYEASDFINTINTVIGQQCFLKGIKFEFKKNQMNTKWILIDRVRFNQIFVNLLSNAVKFTPKGGKIEFIIETISAHDKIRRKRYTIRDNGIGMSKDFLPYAFDSFAQENLLGNAANNQGTGLGLTIVKQLVDLMGGTIKVESELGKGTTFTVELDIEETDEPTSKKTEDNDNSIFTNLHILLCEDNFLNTEIVVNLLKRKGCIVECAANGQIGLEKFKNSEIGTFSVVLMDIRMPVMNGLDATTAIRALDRSDAKKVVIIALSADAFDIDVNDSHNVGMNDHLSKPIDPQALYDTIEKHLKQHN